MTSIAVLMGALLAAAAPAFSQIPAAELKWFASLETRDDAAQPLGTPAMAVDFGNDFRSWQYQIGNSDHDDFSHSVVYRRSTGKLVSVTRNYEPERDVDVLFAGATTHYFPNADNPKFCVRVLKLSGGRLLIAMGVSKPGQKTGQILWMRASEVIHFYPWLAEQH
jgi:hypothetical protein